MTPVLRAPVLRAAVPSDAPRLAELQTQNFAHPWPAHEIVKLLAAPGGFGFVACEGGEILGFVIGRAAADEAEIITVVVDAARRRAGLATALLGVTAALARASGAAALFLEVAVDNSAAAALYEQAGFERAGLRPGYYDRPGTGPIDALVLRRDLTA